MKYRYLGKSGLAVSRVCLGTATFGQKDWGCDEATSHSILEVFSENGGNFIDTSDKYAGTMSEQIIGRWLVAKNRDAIVLATKCFFPTAEDVNARGLSRKHILSACEASLKRLQTDYIDLYQAHEYDPHTPIEETLAAYDSLIQQGKIRYAGFSNWPAWVVVKAVVLAREHKLSPLVSGQYLYNLLKRDIEAEVMPACADSGVGILCWSPLSGGMLTGKYTDPVTPPENSRFADRSDLSAGRYPHWHKRSEAIVSHLKAVAAMTGVHPSVVALSWLLSRQGVASVIIGARSRGHCQSNIQAGSFDLPDDVTQSLCTLSHQPAPVPHDICSGVAKSWMQRMEG